MILFGSRARGDYRRTSDIDLAAEGGDFNRFALDVDEETSTLLKYDIVDLRRKVQPELLESIEREGIVIYEKYENRKRSRKTGSKPVHFREESDMMEEENAFPAGRAAGSFRLREI